MVTNGIRIDRAVAERSPSVPFMMKIHITQQPDTFWMLSVEGDDGEMIRITSGHMGSGHLLHDAREMVRKGRYPGATILIEAPQEDSRHEEIVGAEAIQ